MQEGTQATQIKAGMYLSKWLYLIVLCAGALTVFAFAPFKIHPLAWLTPAVLFYALNKATTKKQYFKLGLAYGIGYFGAGASWPFYSMYFFAHAPLLVAILGTAIFVIANAFLVFGLFAWIASWFRQQTSFTKLLLFYPTAWVLVEWYRGWFLTGFPWLYLGNSQIDSVLASYAPILGVLGVSLVCVLISGALLSIFIGFIDRSVNGSVEKSVNTSGRIFSIFLIIALVSSAYLLQNIQWTQATGNISKVSILQSNISQLDKLDRDRTLASSIELYKNMTAKSRDSDLIVWPETGLFDAFSNHMDSLILPLQNAITKDNQSILMGGFNLNENNTFGNSILAIDKNSRTLYSKRHLVPFGEYIPFVEYIRWMGDWIPYSSLEAGKNDGTLQVAGQLAQMSICYEDAFGAEIIKSLPEATLLINVTHDGWFTGSLEPEQHMQIARMRSLETGRYMVRATTTGPSGIIDEKGKLIATAPLYTQRIITGKAKGFSGATPYVRWGDWLMVGILATVLLLGLFGVFLKRNTLNG